MNLGTKEYDDLIGRYPYYAKWSQGDTVAIDGVEIPISVPDMPDESMMVNYGLPIEEQVFRRVSIPKNLRSFHTQEINEIVDAMWRRRLNGEWWLIGGEPVYIPGTAWLFYNFWYWSSDQLPEFRMEGVEFFQIMLHVSRHQSLVGIIDVKPRRIGDTEKALCFGWDMATRYRNSRFGIQSKTDDDAEDAFNRLTFANQRMVWFFKPIQKGKDRPEMVLEFSYPSGMAVDRRTKSFAHKDENSIHAVDSIVEYRATTEAAFDSTRQLVYLGDEYGKINPKKCNVNKMFNIAKQCVTLNMGTTKVGIMVLPSTIEEMGTDGGSIAVVESIWEGADPKNLLSNGSTANGLLRVFRNYRKTAKVDKFGRHQFEEIEQFRAERINALRNAGLLSELAQFKRQYPATIMDAFARPESDMLMPTVLIGEQIEYLKSRSALVHSSKILPVKGDLIWSKGFGSDVIWVPNENGKWYISRHPENPNAKTVRGGLIGPGNTATFAGGADPYDHSKQRGGSKGAIAIGMVFDSTLESGSLMYEESGAVQSYDMISDSCCCTYSNRPSSPSELYEDGLKTAIYYGCSMLIENQKPGMINFFIERGYSTYIKNRPSFIDSKTVTGRDKTMEAGAPATAQTIQTWVESVKEHLLLRYRNYTHLDLLEQLGALSADNRTSLDLAVAWGWCRVNINSIERINNRGLAKRQRIALPL